jgi:hypothetical protein
MNSEVQHEGGCDCGAIRYRLRGKMRDVVNCHCGQCRRTHGHFGAYTAVEREQLSLTSDRGLRWYRSSQGVRRGFCGECGSSLFWDRESLTSISIAAGTLDQPTGLKTVAHIFTKDAGDYYQLDDHVPRYPGSMRE